MKIVKAVSAAILPVAAIAMLTACGGSAHHASVSTPKPRPAVTRTVTPARAPVVSTSPTATPSAALATTAPATPARPSAASVLVSNGFAVGYTMDESQIASSDGILYSASAGSDTTGDEEMVLIENPKATGQAMWDDYVQTAAQDSGANQSVQYSGNASTPGLYGIDEVNGTTAQIGAFSKDLSGLTANL